MRVQSLASFEQAYYPLCDDFAKSVVVVDERGSVISCSDHFLQALGCAREAVVGRDWFANLVQPASQAEAQQRHAEVWGGTAYSGEYEAEVAVSGGEARRLHWTARLLTVGSGAAVGLALTERGITDEPSPLTLEHVLDGHPHRAFEQSSVGMAVLSLDGTFLYANHALCTMLGYAIGELRGRYFADVTHPDDRSSSRDVHLRLWSGVSEAEHLEKRYLRRDRTVMWADVSVFVLFDSAGRPEAIMAHMQDTTPRHSALTELYAERALLGIVLAAMTDPMWVADVSFAIVYANPAFEATFGPIQGRTCYECFYGRDTRCPDCQAEAVIAGELDTYITQSTVDGRTWKVTHSRIDYPDGQAAVLAVGHDVTDLHQSSERLREAATRCRIVAENTVDWEFWLDPSERFVYCSPSCQTLTGHVATDFLTHPTLLRDLIHPDDVPLFDAHRRHHSPHTGSEESVFRLMHPDGKVRWVEKVCQPVFGEGSTYLGRRISVRDVTTRMQAQAQVAESERKFRSLFEHMLDGFAYHEIILDEQGCPSDYRFLDVNDAFCRLTGLAREAVVGRTVREVMPNIEEEWVKAYGRVALTGEAMMLEQHATALDKWFAVSAYSPTPGHFACVFEDVTERRLWQSRLERSEQRFRQLFERMPSGAVIYQPVDDGGDFVIAAANRAVGTIEGLDPARLVGRRLSEAFPGAAEMGLPDALRRVATTGVPEHLKATKYEDHRLCGWRENLVYKVADGEIVAVYDDKTAERSVEQRLRAQSVFAQSVLDSTDTHIAVIDPQGVIVAVNEAWRVFAHENEAGDPSAWGIGARYVRSLSPTAGDCTSAWDAYEGYNRVRRGELTSFGLDYPCHGPGVPRWFHVNFLPLVGRPGMVLAAHTNITERKEAEAELSLTARILALLNSTQQQFDILDEIVLQIRDNIGLEAAALRLHEGDDFPYCTTRGFPDEFVRAESSLCASDHRGLPVRDATGQVRLECMCGNVLTGRIDHALPFFTPFGSFWTNSTTDLLASTSETERQGGTRNACHAFGYESVALIPVRSGESIIGLLQLNDTRRGCLSPNLIAFLESLSATVGIALMRRMDEQRVRSSAARLQALFRSTPDMMAVKDAQSVYEAANPAFCRFVGKAEAEIIGATDFDVFPIAAAAEYRRSDTSALDSGQVLEADEEVTGAHGRVFFQTIRIPIVDDAGKRLALLCTYRDLTSRRLAEDAQRLATVGSLAAGVAHEFNNLLAGLRLRAEHASLTGAEQDYTKLAAQAIRASARGADVCSDLIAFARPAPPATTCVTVDAAVSCALGVVARQLETGAVSAEVRTDGAPHLVEGDQGQLEQVFTNLFINACHAMPDGGALVVVLRDDAGTSETIVEVCDTGRGIDPQNLSRIFEPFFTTKGRLGESEVPGTGLGLSVAHGIVRAHGGTIGVSSTCAAGTTFELRFPTCEPAHEHSPQSQNLPLQALDPPVRSLRVLVAEDEVDVREALAGCLLMMGHQVVEVGSGQEANAALGGGEFDLVITDLLMPRGGGLDVLATVTLSSPGLPVVVMTGKGDSSLESRLRELGAQAYLRKPFSLSDVRKAINTALEHCL